MSKIEFARFAVDETPNCVWSVDLKERNLDYLRSFDPKFFEWVGSVLSQQLEDGDPNRAAVALRIYYDHALETLFGLLGAAAQAPECVFGWLGRYRVVDLNNVVRKIHRGAPLRTRLRASPLNWDSFAAVIHSGLNFRDEDKTTRYLEAFGRLWRRFANDFLDEKARKEYNSLKHGLRIDQGGFSISVGWEKTPGVPCPPEDMSTSGGSQFGSSFFVLDRFEKYNFESQRWMRNWMPANFVRALSLISISLNNIVTCLRFCNGIPPEELQIRYPDTLEEFDGPWKETPGVYGSTLDVSVPTGQVSPLSRDDILKTYEEVEEDNAE